MTKHEIQLLLEQKEIAKKMYELVKKDCTCPKVAAKLDALNKALDSLNRAAYYLQLEVPA
jgi:hypothetical protein